MPSPLLLHFQDYQKQAQELAQALGIPCAPVTIHYFPDGEVRVTLPPELPDQVLFFRSLDNPNNKLIELLLAVETSRTLGAKHVTLIAPYLCYMRQDIAFNPGDAISQQIVGRFLSRLIDRIVTVDPHLHRINSLDEVMTESDNIVISASEIIGRYVAKHVKNAILIGPDEESEQWVAKAAEKAGLHYHIATKQRFGDRNVDVSLPDINIHENALVLMDDVISTGQTLLQASNNLKQLGAQHIYCVATHVLLSKSDMERLLQAGVAGIFSTDSVNHPTNTISLCALLEDTLKSLTI